MNPSDSAGLGRWAWLARTDFFYFLGQPVGPDGFFLFVEASQAARTDFFYLPGRSDGADGFFF